MQNRVKHRADPPLALKEQPVGRSLRRRLRWKLTALDAAAVPPLYRVGKPFVAPGDFQESPGEVLHD
jgi:hypothetical protein